MGAMQSTTWTSVGLTFREVEPEEWPRLLAFEPFKSAGLPENNGHWKILVAEIDGVIVGCTGLHTQVHWDPWWIAESYRGNGGIVRGLIKQGATILDRLGVRNAFATIEDENLRSQMLAKRLGFEPAPGKLYIINVPELKER